MLNLVNKLFRSSSSRRIKNYSKTVENINKLESSIKALSDSDLKEKTNEFKEKLATGNSINEILPEAFAVVREASSRTLNLRHYDVQLIGGIVLHEGMIAEMKTGEGKTLVATLTAYLNSLTNKLTKQFRKTAFFECLLVLKGGELVDYEVNSHIECECTVIGFTVRRIP